MRDSLLADISLSRRNSYRNALDSQSEAESNDRI